MSKYSIEYEDRAGFLRARAWGPEDSVETSLAYWREIAAECRVRGFQRMLVLENFSQSAALVDVFKVAEQLPEITRGIKVAFVDERLDDESVNQFAEDVAVNRGAFGRVFGDEDPAEKWLLED